MPNSRTGKRLELIGTPVKFSEAKTGIRLPPPALGEHTIDVLSGLGYSEKEISELRLQGIV